MSDPKSFAGRPTKKSDLLGQVFTPPTLALRMVERLMRNRSQQPIKVLDPCVGPLTFPLAMVEANLLSRNDELLTIDIDESITHQADTINVAHNVKFNHFCADYLGIQMDGLFDYAILNPPYVRQEWIDRKADYKNSFEERFNTLIPGTANLYVYFVVKVISELKPGGQFSCILYDSWQSTRYGAWLVDYLNENCSCIQFETVPNQPFHNRLIDATILYGTKQSKFPKVSPTSVTVPEVFHRRMSRSLFSDMEGFSKINEVFRIRRGLRLKQADFFLSDISNLERLGATPFVKKVALLKGLYHIPDDHPEAALLVAPGEQNPFALSELERRLEVVQKEPEQNIAILTWYKDQPEACFFHKPAPYDPILFNYYIRNMPRHIYNSARPYADNFYGLTPLSDISIFAWFAILNSTSVCAELMAHSRNQGNGLAKIQLFEYREMCIPDLRQCAGYTITQFDVLGKQLIEDPISAVNTRTEIDNLIYSVWNNRVLAYPQIVETFQEVSTKARKPKE